MVRATRIGIGLCALVLLAASAEAQAPPAAPGPLWVGPADVAQELELVEPALSDRFRARLRRAGLELIDGHSVRQADLARNRLQELLELAAHAGATRALLIDLDSERPLLHVRLRLYDVTARRLKSIASASTSDGKLSGAADEALGQLVGRLEIAATSLPRTSSQDLQDLALLSRALFALDRRDYAAAWRTLQGRSSPAISRMRSAIEKSSRQPDTTVAGKARLLATRGEMDTAWEMIEPAVEAQRGKRMPDAQVLLAAGEVQLERGEVGDARSYFERALEVAPEQPDGYVGLGRAHELAGDAEAARIAYRRAAKLDTSAPRPLELQAKLSSSNRDERAQLLMMAGERASAQLDAERAQTSFGRAVRLDPTLAADTREKTGDLHTRLHSYDSAAEAYSDAVHLGGPTAPRLKGLARAHRAGGDAPASESVYAQLLEITREDPEAYRELGDLYAESGRVDEAVVHLERALELEPKSAAVHRSLARAKHAAGDDGAALEHYLKADKIDGPTARTLSEAASIERARGDLQAAKRKLERAVEMLPAEPALRTELATVYRESGDETSASEAEYLLLAEEPETGPGSEVEEEEERAPATADSTTFEGLIASFGAPDPELGPVLLLGLREPLKDKELALDWVWPKTLDVAGLEQALVDALAAPYALGRGAPRGKIAEDVEQLFAFEADSALEASTIARVNRAFGTGAVFVARVARRPMGGESACAATPHLEIELRMLAGQLASEVSALGNRLCLAGGLERYGVWNYRAAGIYLVLILLIAFPFVRGWGRVLVTFKFPPKTRPLFSVRISQRKHRSVKVDDTGDQLTNKWKIEEKLQRISPFEKRLTGDRLEFCRVPAKRRPYTVTVKGPMLDAKTGELVGAYQEEKTVQVLRGKEVTVEFDMRPKECCIEVNVYNDGQLAEEAVIALKGVKNSLRYARGKPGFLYVGTGEHQIVAGTGDRVTERSVQVDDLEPVRMSFDLSNEDHLLFWDCPDAVMPYLEGRYLEAADALERAGNTQMANKLRGQGHLQLGNTDEAATAFEAAGDLVEAAELRAESADGEASAVLFEEAGEFGRAAQAYREQGDTIAAARAYERAYDWDSAIECYRELNDSEGLMNALEQSGDHYEAGQMAEELMQIPRALHNYQQVDRRHSQYSDVCIRTAIVLADKGEPDLAIEKFEEAQERMLELFPIAMQTHLASLLEDVGRDEDALSTYESIRRRDHNDDSARQRITEIKKKIETAQQLTVAAEAVASAPPAPAAQESRYEIMGELGRGGMGVVFKARDTNLERVIALKKLPENLKDHPTAVSLFLREARSAAALNHPNIVTVFDAGQESDNYFISMEHLQGTPLDALLEAHGRISPRDTALLGMQAATGLAYAHDNRIIHRDIKTSNLFYTNERVVKIMDFGLAKAVEEVRKNASMIAGTPYFMAPEQSAGGVVDHRADLYALGVTLYQLVTGSVPFKDGDVTYHHRHTPPPDPREAQPDIPDALAELLLQLLEKDPDNRIQSAAEVAQRLRTIAESTPA